MLMKTEMNKLIEEIYESIEAKTKYSMSYHHAHRSFWHGLNSSESLPNEVAGDFEKENSQSKD